MPLIRVITIWPDGHTDTVDQPAGDTETNLKRRLRNARRKFRHGPGWLETDRNDGGDLTYTERLEWPEVTP